MEESGNDKDLNQEHSDKVVSGEGLGDDSSLYSGRGGVVTARGTVDGVVIRLDGRVSQGTLFSAIEEFLSARESFLGGSEVSLEWVGAKPEDSLVAELTKFFTEKFKITIKSSKLKETAKSLVRDVSLEEEQKSFPVHTFEHKKTRSLFDGMDVMESSESMTQREVKGYKVQHAAGVESLWDDADARIIYATLRSGQKIETDHSLVIFGDVNSGAEVVAGGDIVVMGTLRGVAHAGAYDETGGGRMIFALNLRPTQLRIGTVISRSASDVSQKAPEIARVEDGIIIVETYSVKNLPRKI